MGHEGLLAFGEDLLVGLGESFEGSFSKEEVSNMDHDEEEERYNKNEPDEKDYADESFGENGCVFELISEAEDEVVAGFSVEENEDELDCDGAEPVEGDEEEDDEEDEASDVVFSDTIINPGAVVVILLGARVTNVAVIGAGFFVLHAPETDVGFFKSVTVEPGVV